MTSAGFHCQVGLPAGFRQDLRTLFNQFITIENNLRNLRLDFSENAPLDFSNEYFVKLSAASQLIRSQNRLFNCMISLLKCPLPCNVCRLYEISASFEAFIPLLRIIAHNEHLYKNRLDRYKRYYSNLLN